jgi:hypothetical protein
MKRIDHDKEHDIIGINWFEKDEDHFGTSEELNLLGVTIIIDRNKKGQVRSLEII